MLERLPGLGRAGGDEAPLPPGGQSAQAPGGAAQHNAAKMETIGIKVILLLSTQLFHLGTKYKSRINDTDTAVITDTDTAENWLVIHQPSADKTVY